MISMVREPDGSFFLSLILWENRTAKVIRMATFLQTIR